MNDAINDVSDRTELLVYIGIVTIVLLLIALAVLLIRDHRSLVPITDADKLSKTVDAANAATRAHVSAAVDGIRSDTKESKRWLRQIAAKLGVKFEDDPP